MKTEDIYDAIIVGAGPAGLMAAIRAGERGRKVLVLEKNRAAGKKLLLSGKGRCNITNAADSVEDFIKNFSVSGVFLRNALHAFFNKELMIFFAGRGVRLKTERGGRVFPESDRAADILAALLDGAAAAGVSILYGRDITEIKKEGPRFTVQDGKGGSFNAGSVLITTGGMSYPETGSTGSGFAFAAKFGHTVVAPKPALVGLVLAKPLLEWQGISLKNVECSLDVAGKIAAREFGEMLFTHFGVSGPIILDISAAAYDAVASGKKTHISVDFKPALDYHKLESRMIREFETAQNKNVSTVMKALLPSKMAGSFPEACGVAASKKINQVTKEERAALIKGLKAFRAEVKSVRPLKEAIVTRGGIATKEINPKTMESRLAQGLFFAGEIIDVDAVTGGFNLQAAFSTGYVAGEHL